jgi:sulfide dehydrogenase [flavocytochrome c] flavoprotein subunit
VTLIDKDKDFVSGPLSNEVISGERDLAFITFSFDARRKQGINVVHDEVVEIDPAKKTVKTKGGKTFEADYLVVAPGISFKWGAIEGYDEAASKVMPHAWLPGEQTLLLKKRIEAVPDGGLVVIVAPPNPFRCPPGPYERAAQFANYFVHHGRKKCKVIILDSKDAFSKQGLFTAGWKHNYGDMIEWIGASGGGKVSAIDPKGMVIQGEFDEYKVDAASVIAPHHAGAIAVKAGLTDEKGWCPVDQATFESKKAKDVFVVGDSCIPGAMPKSGYAANSQGKVVAAVIAARALGVDPPKAAYTNTCYSVLAPDYGISVAGVYQVGPQGTLVEVPGSGGVSPADETLETRAREAVYQISWFRNIKSDGWG